MPQGLPTIPLDDDALIRVSGDDASTFLQNLLCNDVRKVTAKKSQLTGLMNTKGRTLAVIRLFWWADAYGLIVPRALADTVCATLQRYILRARVSVTISDSYQLFGLCGQNDSLPPLPTAIDDVQASKHVVQIRITGNARWLAIINTPYTSAHAATPVADALAHWRWANALDDWRGLECEAGIARLTPDTSGLFLPQTLNLDRLNAISFDKGCYIGQEIIARLHYRGNVKRRIRCVRLPQAQPVGTTCTIEGARATLVQCGTHPDGSTIALAAMAATST